MLDDTTNDGKTSQLVQQHTDDANARRAKQLNTYGFMGVGYEGQEVAAIEDDNPALESDDDNTYGDDSNDLDDDGVDDDLEAERNRFDFENLLSKEVRDATARFSNLGFGDGAAGQCLYGLNDGAKLIIQAKERETANAESRASTPDGFLNAKEKEADLALFKARLVEREAERGGNSTAYAEAQAAEDKILQQQQALDTLKTEFAKPGADKSSLLLAAYGSEYEAARRGSTATLLADGKGVSTKAQLNQQFELAASPQITALIPEVQLQPLLTPVYQAGAPSLPALGGRG